MCKSVNFISDANKEMRHFSSINDCISFCKSCIKMISLMAIDGPNLIFKPVRDKLSDMTLSSISHKPGMNEKKKNKSFFPLGGTNNNKQTQEIKYTFMPIRMIHRTLLQNKQLAILEYKKQKPSS